MQLNLKSFRMLLLNVFSVTLNVNISYFVFLQVDSFYDDDECLILTFITNVFINKLITQDNITFGYVNKDSTSLYWYQTLIIRCND